MTAVLQDKTQQDLMFPSPILLLSFSGVYTRRWATLPEDEHGQIYGRVSDEVWGGGESAQVSTLYSPGEDTRPGAACVRTNILERRRTEITDITVWS